MATSTATTTTFSSTGSIQTETITISGTYDIVVDGAEGGSAFGNAGGLGSIVSGDVFLQAGAQLEIIVGGVGGAGGTALGGGGGGGGSFVIETNTGSSPIDINELIAGGGGGAGKSSGGVSSSVTGSAVAALGGSDSNTGGGGGGGGGFTGGAGGFDFGSFFATPAANGSVSGQSFSGGAGGGGGGKGGFGGGGGGGGGTKGIGGGGGGGGYGGGSGGGSTYGGGGGGGSYVNPNVTNVSETPGVNAGAGLVSISLVACFCAGTRIKTARGECAIEDLAIGDRLLTRDGRLRSLRWIGRRSYAGPMLQANSQLWPILIRAGALADAVPARDLRMSATHALYFNAMLIPAGNLVNGATISREQPADQVDYFNLEVDSHDVILAEGAPAESYIDLDNRNMFQNAAEYVAPTTLHLPAVECAPRIEFGHELRVLRTRLAARARALGFVVAESHRVALTTRGVTKAKIPAGASVVHLRSTTDRVNGDHRSLGALIAGLHLDGHMIDLRDPCLSSGFHSIEPHGTGFMRWTNGDAVITLAPTAFERIIEIDIATIRGSQHAA